MKLLDLYSGAGGASVGYYRAGFTDITGVDIVNQPHYPFVFVQANALPYLREHGYEFDAIHASPPCQAHTQAQRIRGYSHTDLIGPTRDLLRQIGKPYIIENVPGAPLINPIQLVGTMFGLKTMRPRLFECSFEIPFMLAPPMPAKQVKMGRPPRSGEFVQVVGHFANVDYAREAMGIDWMTRNELAQAIPPAYTEYLGHYLMEHIQMASSTYS